MTKKPIPPPRPGRKRQISPEIPSSPEIEWQVKKFLTDIAGNATPPTDEAGFLNSVDVNQDFILKFSQKLSGPPWFLQLHPSNLVGNLDLQYFIEFIRLRLIKAKRDSLLVPRGIKPHVNFPISFPQEQIWLQMQDSSAPTLYNYSGHFYFPPDVDVRKLRESLIFLVQRHDTLRCAFLEINGKPCQFTLPEAPPLANIIESVIIRKEICNLRALLARNLHRPFELGKKCMFHFYLFIINGKYSLLQFVCHHLVTDGTGFYIMEQELRKLQVGNVNFPANDLNYSDYVLWQRDTSGFEETSKSAEFWRQYLKGITTLEIPRDKPKLASIGLNSARVKFEFPTELSDKIRRFSKSCNVTTFVALLGGLNALFYRYIPQSSISLLTAKHGRTNSKLRSIVGHFVNTLVVRTFLNGDLTFREILQNINSSLTSIYQNEEYPFQYVLRDLIASNTNSGEELDKVALFPVFVVMMPKYPGQSSNSVSNYTDIDNNLLTNEMTILFDEGCPGTAISGFIKYNPELHSRGRILRMVEHLKTLLDSAINVRSAHACACAHDTLSNLNIIPPLEMSLLSKFSKGKCVYFNPEQTLIELFEYIAHARPHNLAAIEGNVHLTFQMLNQMAGKLAQKLVGQNPCLSSPQDEFIAIFLPQSIDNLIAVLAILKSRKTVVPLNVHASSKQVEVMLRELGYPLLVSSGDLLEKLGLSYSRVFRLDRLMSDTPPSVSELPSNLDSNFKSPAFCIFTSGSTGKPKGVSLLDSSIINLVNWMQSEFEVVASDRMLLFSNSAYDAALLEYWPYLLAGAAVLIPPSNVRYAGKELMNWVVANGVTVMNLPTTLASSVAGGDFLRISKIPAKLRLLSCGGEILRLRPSPSAGQLPFRMVNSYGLTEGCVLTTSGPVDQNHMQNTQYSNSNIIGKPIWNTEVYVLDGNLKMAPIGIPGEICIGGAGVSTGYVNNPEMNVAKFIENPFARASANVHAGSYAHAQGKLCKTGDMGYWLPDGNLCFVGRADYQVKIRGHRVELGEIETALSMHPSVQEAVVCIEQGGDSMAAYCEVGNFKNSHRRPTHEDMFKFLQGRLPYYAIPTSIYFLDDFPYNANGKVDRIATTQNAKADGGALLAKTFESVLSPEEKIVAQIWADVLSIPANSIGRQSNFFALGGQSMLIADVVNRLKGAPLFVQVKVADLFRDPTLVGFTQVVMAKIGKIAIQVNHTVPAEVIDLDLNNNSVFRKNSPVQLSAQQKQLWIHMQNSKDLTLYNEACSLTFRGHLDIPAMKESIMAIFRRHDILRCGIFEMDGKPHQVVRNIEVIDLQLSIIDLTHVTVKVEQDQLARASLSGNRLIIFDFESGPLLRFSLLKFPGVTRMQIIFHHLVMDAIGINIFEAELRYFYEKLSQGVRIPRANPHELLPPLQYQYSDFVAAQRENSNINMKNLSAQKFWTNYLEDLTPLNLQTDRPRNSYPENLASKISGSTGIQLSAKLTTKIKEFSRMGNTTVFVTLTSALKALVYRYTRQTDVVLMCATSGRNDPKFEKLIGYFVNMTALRTRDLSGDLTFQELVRKVHESAGRVFEYQDFPPSFNDIDGDGTIEKREPGALLRLGVTMEPRLCTSSVPNSKTNPSTFFFERIDYGAKFELLVCFDEVDDRIHILFAYNRSLYDADRIDRMASHFENLLESVVQVHDQALSTNSNPPPIKLLDFMSLFEKKSTMGFGLGETTTLPIGARIHELFEVQAQSRGNDRIRGNLHSNPNAAIFENGEYMSYAELNASAECLKDVLLYNISGTTSTCAHSDDQFVAILLPQSTNLVISTLAVMKAGKTVVPLSIDYPIHQLNFVLTHLKFPLLITTAEILKTKELGHYSRVHFIEKTVNPATIVKNNFTHAQISNPIAYCIFTSGSTGVPKAVLVRHDAIVHFAYWMISEYQISAYDKSLLFFTPAFDFSFAEIWPFLLCGGCLCIPPDDLRHSKVIDLNDWVTQHGVTIACLPTVKGEMFFKQVTLSSLRWLIIGGESLRSYPPPGGSYAVSLWYGLTEATVVTSFMHYGSTHACHTHSNPPVGKPMPNSQIYVLDAESREFQPVGIPGEIFIGGFGVSPGYYEVSPEVNDQKFIVDYLSLHGKLCRTGDLGYWLPDGNLVVMGRGDWQVKIRGYRIELGEIETALCGIPGITQAIVIRKDAYAHVHGDTMIGFCTGTYAPAQDYMKLLKQMLPQYAIPTAVYWVEKFPVNSTGKVDRKALFEMGVNDREFTNLLRRHFESPGTREEKFIAKIWASILGRSVGSIGRNDDFFSLGGHSMLAIEIVSKLRAPPYFFERRVVDVFRCPILADFAKLIDFESRQGQRQNIMTKKFKRVIQNFPLSFAQEQIWLHAQEIRGNPLLYNEAFSLNFMDNPAVDVEAIERGLLSIFQRHEILRSNIQEVNGKPTQKIASLEKSPPNIPVLDYVVKKGNNLKEFNSFSRKLASRRQQTPFLLESGSLFRVFLIRFKPEYIRMQVFFHHLIMDAVSVGIFERELRTFYEIFKNNKNVEIPMDQIISPLPMQYYDYVFEQRRQETKSCNALFWRGYLKDLTPLELPTDSPRIPGAVGIQGHSNFSLTSKTSEMIKNLSRELQTTPFVVFLTAIKTLLYRYTRQNDIFIVSTTSGRNHPNTEDLIGYFVNMIIFRTTGFADHVSFREMVKRVHESTMKVYEHQDTPFQSILANSDLSNTKSSLFRLVVTMEPRGQRPCDSEQPHCSAYSEALKSQPKYELGVGIDEFDGCFNVGFLYNAALFSAQKMNAMAKHFENLLVDGVQNSGKGLQNLTLLSAQEREMILYSWNRTDIEFANNLTVLQQFEAQVYANPSNVAIVDELGVGISYSKLNANSIKLANSLQVANWNSQNEFVAVLLPQCANFIISTIAILKLGKACVPINIFYTAGQIIAVLGQLNSPLMITTKTLAKNLGIDDYPGLHYIENMNFTTDQANMTSLPPRSNLDASASTAAYCVCTSGTTGAPKAVRVEHTGLTNLINWFTAEFKFTNRDKSLISCNPAFDISFVEIWPTLVSGGMLAICPESVRFDNFKLRAWTHRNRITFAALPTSVAEKFCSEWEFQTTSLRHVAFGGERLFSAPSSNLPFKVTHMYGLSETTVLSTFVHLGAGAETDSRPFPPETVGKPIANTQLYILDEMMNFMPPGIRGDIYIGGVGVSSGYVNNVVQTDAKFIENPFMLNSHQKLCKTGDVGYWTSDGNLCVVGRLDNQIKINGHRIELEEIEAAITKFPGVAQVVVQIDESQKNLTAYCVLAKHLQVVHMRGMPDFLQQHLPYYAIPSSIFVLPNFPLNSIGKIDRKALRVNMPGALDLETAIENAVTHKIDACADAKPKTEAEITISQVWGKVLQRSADTFKITDNFFAVGGNSMLIMQVILELKVRAPRADVITSTIFSNPILRSLAKLIEKLTQPVLATRPTTRARAHAHIPLKSNIDYSIEKIDLTLPNGTLSAKIQNILLTGATGYLGSGILVELLAKTDAKIHCLIRAGNQSAGRERLTRAIAPFTTINEFVLKARVICIVGDLSENLFGLPEPVYNSLSNKIDVVYHCAAEVHFLKSYQDLRSANVESTKQMLKFTTARKLKVLHFISTLGVVGYNGVWAKGMGEEKPLAAFKFDANDLSDGYSQSKWVAEKLVWDAIACGVPCIIYRPGEIGCHSTKNIINKSDMFATVVKSCVEMRTCPDYNTPMPYGSLDFVCGAIVKISLKSSSSAGGGKFGKVYHVFEHLVALKDVLVLWRGRILLMGIRAWHAELMKFAAVVQKQTVSNSNNSISPVIMLSLFLGAKGGVSESGEMIAKLEKDDGVTFSNCNLLAELRHQREIKNELISKKENELRRYLELLLCKL